MSNKKYWRSVEELNDDPSFLEQKKHEFSEPVPLVAELEQNLQEAKTDRRDFLKVLGFSLGAATLAASCETPIRKAIPYVVKPEVITPGTATYYASTFVNGNDVLPVLVKTREGRPIKIEGNTDCKLTGGGTSARAQASVVSLYDSARLRAPKSNGETVSWEKFDAAVKQGLSRSSGEVVFLTGSVTSVATKRLLDEFKQRFGATVVQYDALSQTGMLLANEQSFGSKRIPSYHFEKADVIVGVECDFLNTWISPTTISKQYISNRQPSEDHPNMTQHFQFESHVTGTGAKADYRRSIKPSQLGAVLMGLYKAIGGSGAGANSGIDLGTKVQEAIDKAGKALRAHKGKALVVCGANDVNCQIITNAINAQLAAYSSCIDFSSPLNTYQGDDQAMANLVQRMNAGRVAAIIMDDVNPAYDYPKAGDFKAGLAKVGHTVLLADRENETAELVKHVGPKSHYLESWDMIEPTDGTVYFQQPTIAPLFDSRQTAEFLMGILGTAGTVYDYLRTTAQSVTGRMRGTGNFEQKWSRLVGEGVAHLASSVVGATPTFSGNIGSAAKAVAQAAQSSNGTEVVFYESISMGDGRYANNPFLQETPDSISKVTWENVAIVPLDSEYNTGDVVKLTANGKEMTLPATKQPGLKSGVVAVALGYGRTKPGNEKCATGANAYPFCDFDGTSFQRWTSGASLSKVSGGYRLGSNQNQHTIDDEREIINETTLKEYKANRRAGNISGSNLDDEHYTHHYISLYPGHDEQLKQGHHWGMAIDLNSCTGCNACVVSCNIENNVPVVGRDEVHRGHDMHWLRIDRYYSYDREGDPNAENPEVAFMPMMCQHCDSAPCENVCPVNASNHSSEGLNQMAYNRCIGTRYCANNCPYKVRRFNWYDYQGADSWTAADALDNDQSMLDNLSRMVLNPDVTVRSRGVMEKCSFCVQRIQEGKLEAKKEGRKVKDGEIATACQAACTTGAITFGDMNDAKSAVSIERENKRAYDLLQDIHVMPSVKYFTMVRNKEKIEGRVKGYIEPTTRHGSHDGHDAHGHDDKKSSGHGHDDHGKDDHGDHGHGH